MCAWRLLPTLRRESIDRNTLYWLELDGARLLRPRPALCGERAARCVNEKKRVRDDLAPPERWYCDNKNRGCPEFYAQSSTDGRRRHLASCKYKARPELYKPDKVMELIQADNSTWLEAHPGGALDNRDRPDAEGAVDKGLLSRRG